MAKLTTTQISSYAKLAGFSGSDVNIATGVAMAESGGETTAHNSKPPDDSYGLMQINMIGALGPDRRKKFGISKNDELFDPQKNMDAAYIVWKGSGWNAWTTYKNGAYKKFSDDAGSSGVGDVAAALTPEQGIGSALNAVGLNIFRSLSNVIGVIVAAVLLIAAVVIFAMQSKVGKKAVKSVAGKVIP